METKLKKIGFWATAVGLLDWIARYQLVRDGLTWFLGMHVSRILSMAWLSPGLVALGLSFYVFARIKKWRNTPETVEISEPVSRSDATPIEVLRPRLTLQWTENTQPAVGGIPFAIRVPAFYNEGDRAAHNVKILPDKRKNCWLEQLHPIDLVPAGGHKPVRLRAMCRDGVKETPIQDSTHNPVGHLLTHISFANPEYIVAFEYKDVNDAKYTGICRIATDGLGNITCENLPPSDVSAPIIEKTDREKEIEAIVADGEFKEERRTIKNPDGSRTIHMSVKGSIGGAPMIEDSPTDTWLYWYNERKRIREELDMLEATPGLDDIPVAEQMVRRLNPREIHQDRERKRKIERVKQELNLIDERMNALSPNAPNTPLGRAELAKERLLLEDEVARKEAEIEHNKKVEGLFATPLSPLFKVMAGPDANTLIRGDIERRKKRINEINGILGSVS